MSIQVGPKYVDKVGQSEARLIRGPIELKSISPREWRVTDVRVAADDADSLLGFVERVDDDRYEVLRLGAEHSVDRLRFSSLYAVLASFDDR